MKYLYAYKSADGVRHESSIDAPSREAAFAALRARGIRAIKVAAADGSKANGEVRGVRRRFAVATAVLAALLAGGAAFVAGLAGRSGAIRAGAESRMVPRHQIYGDPAVVGEIDRGNFPNAFSCRRDEMLAWFAQPGRITAPDGTDVAAASAEFDRACAEAGAVSAPAPAAAPEIAELRRIVAGMNAELAAYLAEGGGTPRTYWVRLRERTETERRIYEQARRELSGDVPQETFDARNGQLRRLGLRTIPRVRSYFHRRRQSFQIPDSSF